jgi:DNA-binding transcriptional regulator YiaG
MTEFKKIRLEAGLSQAEAAKLLGRSVTMVAMWDRGDKKCDRLLLIAFKSLVSGANGGGVHQSLL